MADLITWDIKYYSTDDYVKVKVDGIFTSSSLKTFTAEVIETLNQNNCLKLFLDFRMVGIKFSILDVYHLPVLFKKMDVDYKTQTALIPSENNKHKEIYDFFETVCFNKGYSIKQFKNIDNAKHWLANI